MRANCCGGPQHRSLGQFFQDELASPFGLDVCIRLPESIPNSRLAAITSPGRLEALFGLPLSLTLDAMNRHSNIYRALEINPGTAVYFDRQRFYARNPEKCRRAAGSALRAASRMSIACSPPVDGSWGFARKHWTCRRTGDSTGARLL